MSAGPDAGRCDMPGIPAAAANHPEIDDPDGRREGPLPEPGGQWMHFREVAVPTSGQLAASNEKSRSANALAQFYIDLRATMCSSLAYVESRFVLNISV